MPGLHNSGASKLKETHLPCMAAHKGIGKLPYLLLAWGKNSGEGSVKYLATHNMAVFGLVVRNEDPCIISI